MKIMEKLSIEKLEPTKYLFFTGKGGVGKTSAACAIATALADNNKNVLLISTDPASNLQDVFETQIDGKGKRIEGIKNLTVVNIDPIKAAAEYRESIVAPYRGKLPASALANMEEQLSGSCTVEIAAFNEFTRFLADNIIEKEYDFIIFDTAPTGHTLRMLELPSAWTGFLESSNSGASCLGQLSGLGEKRDIYSQSVKTLCDSTKTTLILVARPDTTSLAEADRASNELSETGIKNQVLIINGLLEDSDDQISKDIFEKQQAALNSIPKTIRNLKSFYIPLKSFNILGLENVRKFFNTDVIKETYISQENAIAAQDINAIIDELYVTHKKVIFTMGKGGVGKTSIASLIAKGIAAKGKKVHLTTTDPTKHLQEKNSANISTSFIDEKLELENYKKSILSKARAANMNEDDIDYIEEDLRSPCTQEIAVFTAFSKIVEHAENEIVIIDTAPAGHTLLLLDSTQSYHKEVKRGQGNIPKSVQNLLPRLTDKSQTEVIIVTLAEATPVYEAERLEEDLKRAGIAVKWWVINASYYAANPSNKLLAARAKAEIKWINRVAKHTDNNIVLIPFLI